MYSGILSSDNDFLEELSLWGYRLVWSRLRDPGSRDSGSNPGSPTTIQHHSFSSADNSCRRLLMNQGSEERLKRITVCTVTCILKKLESVVHMKCDSNPVG